MRFFRFFIVGLAGLTFSCSTEVAPVFDEAAQLEKDLILIDGWLADNNITNVIIHPTGIRYTINTKGLGAKVELTDIVRLSYEGRFLDTAEVFDSGTVGPVVVNPRMPFIEGWYHMIIEMSEGDKITTYLPSKYAYGNQGSPGGSVGPNIVLVFDMNMDRIGN